VLNAELLLRFLFVDGLEFVAELVSKRSDELLAHRLRLCGRVIDRGLGKRYATASNRPSSDGFINSNDEIGNRYDVLIAVVVGASRN
jgi:hypothetical protein